MFATYQSLGWKELHEQKWAVLAAIAIALFIPVSVAAYDLSLGWDSIVSVLIVYPFVGGVFFGMRAAAGERAQRTAPFVSSLPIETRVLGSTKLIAAIIGALIPIVVLLLLLWIFTPLAAANVVHPLWRIAGIGALVTIHVLLFVAVFGVGQASEIQAAIRGVLALAIWAAAALYVFHFWPKNQIVQYVRCIGPPGEWFFAILDPRPVKNIMAVPQVVGVAASMLTLGAVFIARYGQAIQPLKDSKWLTIGGWLPQRLHSPVAALAWKQAAETVPMSLAVLGTAVIFSLLWGWEIRDQIELPRLSRTLELFPVIALLGGFLLALLIGVGTFAADLEPRVNTFWRSRPISASAWFWSKYLIGAAAMLLTLGLPALCCACWLYGRNLPADQAVEFVLVTVAWGLAWLLVFAVAAATACVVRHTLYASILTTGVVIAFVATVFWRASTTGIPPSSAYVVAVISGGVFAATLAGWWLAVRDVVAYQT